jgi:hypothetical protein
MGRDPKSTRGQKRVWRDVPVQSALAGFGVEDRVGGAVRWDEATPALIADVCVSISRIGGAVLFGGSRDGGALLVTLHLDGDKKNIWIRVSDDVDGELRYIIEKLRALE